MRGEGDPRRQCFAEGHVDGSPSAQQVVVANGDVATAIEQLRRRRPRHHVDGAAGGVLPEQRALRPAQHLDALDVEEVRVQRERRSDVDAIHVVGDGRIGDGVLVGLVANAADGNDGLEALVLGNRDTGRHGAQVHEREDVADV